MAPLDPNVIPTLYLEMATPYGRRVTELRFQETVGIDGATTTAIAFIDSVKSAISSQAVFDKARWRGAGSHLSFPITWTPIAGTHATAMARHTAAVFVSYTGRTSQGRRCRVTVYGQAFMPSDNTYRFEAAEGSAWHAGRAALASASAPVVAIDGLAPFWNPWVNVGVNAYYQRKLRRS